MARRSNLDEATAMRLLAAYQRCGSQTQSARELGVSEDTAGRYFSALREGCPFLFDIPKEQRHREAGRQIVSGYVYLIRGDRWYKIGKSIKPTSRLRQFRLPFQVDIVHTIHVSDMDYAERYLHSVFADHHIRNEWFQLSSEDVAWICSLTSLEP